MLWSDCKQDMLQNSNLINKQTNIGTEPELAVGHEETKLTQQHSVGIIIQIERGGLNENKIYLGHVASMPRGKTSRKKPL